MVLGVMETRATLAEEPFKTYSKRKFAFVCNMMWMDMICRHIFRVQWTQDASVFRRNITVSNIAQDDRKAYRKECGSFNEGFNSARGGLVKPLSLIKVLPGSFAEKNDFIDEVTQRYNRAFGVKYLAAERGDEDY